MIQTQYNNEDQGFVWGSEAWCVHGAAPARQTLASTRLNTSMLEAVLILRTFNPLWFLKPVSLICELKLQRQQTEMRNKIKQKCRDHFRVMAGVGAREKRKNQICNVVLIIFSSFQQSYIYVLE